MQRFVDDERKRRISTQYERERTRQINMRTERPYNILNFPQCPGVDGGQQDANIEELLEEEMRADFGARLGRANMPFGDTLAGPGALIDPTLPGELRPRNKLPMLPDTFYEVYRQGAAQAPNTEVQYRIFREQHPGYPPKLHARQGAPAAAAPQGGGDVHVSGK